MNLRWVLGIVLVLALMVGTVSANLIPTNAANGCESGSCDEWQPTEAGETITSDATIYHGGARSIKVVVGGSVGGIYFYQKVPVKPNREYTLYAWGRPETITYFYQSIEYSYWNGVGYTASTPSGISGAIYSSVGSFTNGSKTFTTPANCDNITIVFVDEEKTGIFYVDEVVLEESNAVITTYPMQFLNNTRILPNSDTNLPPAGLNVSSNITPGNYEASSFVIKTNNTLSDVTITATELSDGAGHNIPTSAIDIKTIKSWYQADNNEYGYSAPIVDGSFKYILTPELLLNNDSIIRVNTTAQTNEFWNFNTGAYAHIDNTTIDAFPSTAKIYDNKTAEGFPQPFGLTTNENRQIWITTYAASDQAAGNYTGKVWINSSVSDSVGVNISVRVLPFVLQNSTKEHAMYYFGDMGVTTPVVLSDLYKTSTQYAADLANMKAHGISYPTMDTYYSESASVASELALRSSSGLPKDKIYLYSKFLIPRDYYYNDTPPFNGYDLALTTDPTMLNELRDVTLDTQTLTESYGFGEVYAYGVDEPTAADIPNMSASLTAVTTEGSKTYYAVNSPGRAIPLVDVSSMLAIPGMWSTNKYIPNSTEAALYKSANPLIKTFAYSIPQSGIEAFELYRMGYGYILWKDAQYDGSLTFCYQKKYGQTMWNDYDWYDGGELREHTFTYPATDHPIDTIQWEGYREGVDDSRYADTLSYITGNTTEATTIINDGIAAGQDMSVIRAHLIDHILGYGSVMHPTAEFTAYPLSGVAPLTVTFADLSTDSPTSWSWSYSNDTVNWTVFGTTQNPSVVLPSAGVYAINLTASNIAGTDDEIKTGYVTVYATATAKARDDYATSTTWIFGVVALVFLIPTILLASTAITTMRTGQLDPLVVAGVLTGVLILITVFGFMILMAGAIEGV